MNDQGSRKRKAPGDGAVDKKPKALKAEATPKVEKEKRTDRFGNTVRFKSKPTIKDLQRIERALPGSCHRLFLVDRKPLDPPGSADGAREEFTVLGNTGNVYDVHIGRFLNCSCPDFQRGNLCKHILFVMLRVLKLGQDDHRVWQRALLKSEADEVLSGSRSRGAAADPSVMASQRVQQYYKQHKAGSSQDASQDAAEGGDARPLEGECPICCDDLTPAEPTVSCHQCKNHLHKACMLKWKAQRQEKALPVSCVYCRAEWIDPAGEAPTEGGYLNLKNVCEVHERGAEWPADYYNGQWAPRNRGRGGRAGDYDEYDF